MRILFAGSSLFSLPSLKAAEKNAEVVAVLTRNDKPAGRKLRPQATPVKLYAQEKGIPVIDSESLRSECRDEVARYKADIMLCAAYGKFFGEKFLKLFPKGSVNVHPSLLPRFRGASPILAAMLAGDEYTGVSLQKITLEMDAGDIILQFRRPLRSTYTYGTLMNVLADDAAKLVAKLLGDYEKYYEVASPQLAPAAVYTLKCNAWYGYLLWAEPAEQIVRMVRSFAPPLSGVKARYKDTVLKFWDVQVFPEELSKENGFRWQKNTDIAPGTVLGTDTEYGIIIRTVRDCIAVRELQLANKKRMFWKDFLLGQKNFIGETLH